MTAPPTTAVIISPEPLLVIGPRPAMPSVKMFGNMIEFRNPQNTSAPMATLPDVHMEMAIMAAAAKPKMRTRFPHLRSEDVRKHDRVQESAEYECPNGHVA